MIGYDNIMKFYLNDITKEVHAVEELDDEFCIIVNFLPDSTFNTLTVWKGKLDDLEGSWVAKPWNVGGALAQEFENQFWSVVHELSYQLESLDFNHQLDIEEELIDEYQ